MNSTCVNKGRKVSEIVPPFEQEAFTDHPKPRGNLHLVLFTFLYQFLQLFFTDVPMVHYLVRVGSDGDIFLREEDVIDFVLPPKSVGGSLVVDPCEISEVVQGDLRKQDNLLTEIIVDMI